MAVDAFLEVGASDGGGVPLRDSGPWRTHTGARTPPEGLWPTDNPCWSREAGINKEKQKKPAAY